MKEKSEFMSALELNNCKLNILEVIKGLEKESERVRESFETFKPDIIAVSLSSEDLDMLRNFKDELENAEPDNFEEALYIRELKKYGDVKKPPPCYLAAVKVGLENNVPCTAIDMNEEEYTDAFCRNIHTLDLYRHSWSANRTLKRKFDASTPEELVIAIDKVVTRINSYRKLEEDREKHMAEKLIELSKVHERILTSRPMIR
jgi:pheromone shutdown protein TraB